MLDHSKDRQVPISLGGIMWICEKCNGENVSQEWSMFLPMNALGARDEVGFEDKASWLQRLDSYWCDDCDEQCSPIRKNPEKT